MQIHVSLLVCMCVFVFFCFPFTKINFHERIFRRNIQFKVIHQFHSKFILFMNGSWCFQLLTWSNQQHLSENSYSTPVLKYNVYILTAFSYGWLVQHSLPSYELTKRWWYWTGLQFQSYSSKVKRLNSF